MAKRKILHVNTGMFSLDVFYNSAYVGAQVAIFIGLGALRLFGRNDATHKMCTVFLIVDILVLLFIFFNGASVSIEDPSAEEEASKSPPDKEDIDVKVEHKDSSKKETTKPVKEKKEQVIKNKVPLPTDTVTPIETPAPAPSPSPEPVKSETPEQSAKEAVGEMKTLEEMSEEDWALIFGNMDQ